MNDPSQLDGRRVHAVIYLATNPGDQRTVTGIAKWDAGQLTIVPDNHQPPLPIPLFEGRAPIHQITPQVRAAIAASEADNASVFRQAASIADFFGAWPVDTLPEWAAQVAEPLAMAWIPGWRTS